MNSIRYRNKKLFHLHACLSFSFFDTLLIIVNKVSVNKKKCGLLLARFCFNFSKNHVSNCSLTSGYWLAGTAISFI